MLDIIIIQYLIEMYMGKVLKSLVLINHKFYCEESVAGQRATGASGVHRLRRGGAHISELHQLVHNSVVDTHSPRDASIP